MALIPDHLPLTINTREWIVDFKGIPWETVVDRGEEQYDHPFTVQKNGYSDGLEPEHSWSSR